MAAYNVSESRFRCVLPFEAEAPEIQVLRRAVAAQLMHWSLPSAVEEAQLVVSELATNVLKHVGDGAAGVLVIEMYGQVLRLEMHDTSHKVPSPVRAQCGKECGRGLHLLAHFAKSWGTMITASGKAVWCEMSVGADRESAPERRAMEALMDYAGGRREQSVPSRQRQQDVALEDSAVRLIADLLHWAAAHGRDPDDVLDWAQRRYEAESEAA